VVRELSNNGKFCDELFFALIDDDLENWSRGQDPCSPRMFAAKRLRNRLRKKYCPEGCRNKAADANAINKFLLIQESLRRPKIVLDPLILGEMQAFIYHVIEHGMFQLSDNPVAGTTFDTDVVLQRWNTGPGSSNGSDFTHFVEKFGDNQLSFSNAADLLLPYLANISPLIFGRFIGRGDGCLKKVGGSKGACVPKTPEESRFIGSEPVVNMCGQLALGNTIADCLKLIGLDISKQQPLNQVLALMGSIVGDSVGGTRLCTIDLSSASDWISLPLLCKLLPRDVYRYVVAVRSQTIDIVDDSGMVNTHIIRSASTMGNGFTFPIMTLILLAAVYAVGRTKLGWKRNHVPWDVVGVFGDDIICPSSIYKDVVEVLEGMFLKVNKDKSYYEGYFRESCGGDYFQGYNVTPFYIKDLTQISGRVIALNQLIKWSSEHQIHLKSSFWYLVDSIPSKYRNEVPSWDADYAGIKTTRPMRAYTRASLRFRPKVSHCHADFKLVCAVGGYIIPIVNGKSRLDSVTVADYSSRELSAIELELISFCYFDSGRVTYLPRESQSTYVLHRCDDDPKRDITIPYRASIGRGGYNRRSVWLERLAYMASVGD